MATQAYLSNNTVKPEAKKPFDARDQWQRIGSLIALQKGQSKQNLDGAKFHHLDKTNEQVPTSTIPHSLSLCFCFSSNFPPVVIQ